ncbi:PREDICTED: zinc finger protein 709-like [Polistes dominula]|uniref:Zinc finger protein 709-like n=1 Tax=Polistes dominula TaxID=743375 RepID=A0ABM1ITX5_POLDO|nr:PREDICTED: zinc finger protein 709-like [Polistes dominula]
MTNQDNYYLCRVCLSSSNDNQPIFSIEENSTKDKSVHDLSQKLWLCGGIEVAEDDGLPKHICIKCIVKVNAAHQLREQCQRADVKLRQLYGKAIKKADTLKDQYCQTEEHFSLVTKEENNYSFIRYHQGVASLPDEKSSETSSEKSRDKSRDKSSNVRILKESDDGNIKTSNEIILSDNDDDDDDDDDDNNKLERLTDEVADPVPVVKREAYRTRRLTMFKRVTSMENLKNHRERQRQYIKKNGNTKYDNGEKDVLLNVENVCNKVVRVSSATRSNLNLKCTQCNRCYSSKKSLERHILTTHNNEAKFQCQKCKKEFFQIDQLLQHGKLHRSNDKSKLVPCKICNKSFRKTDTMVRHLNVHKRVNPKEVFSILKEIRDRRKLENNVQSLEMNNRSVEDEHLDDRKADVGWPLDGHDNNGLDDGIAKLTSKHVSDTEDKITYFYTSSSESNSDNNKSDSFDGIPVYRCKHCIKCYRKETSLKRHLLKHEERKFVCNVCNMKFVRQDRLKSHRDRYGHDEDKDCSIPQKPPDDKLAIKLINSWIREELDSDNEGKGFPCEICGKSYDTKKSLLKHQTNTHEVQEENCCLNCGKECSCAIKCKGNRKNNEKEKNFTCLECNKSFEKEIKLQRHMRIHERTKEQQDSNFKRFLCHICSKTFRQNTGLMFHMRTHTGYKPHVCKYCGRGFTSNSNCINHERTHTGDRPFVCHFCSAAFAKSCTLKAHITTHTGEANYHCKTCGKSFRRLKYLKEHRFTHTGEKPYACKICGTAYSHSGSLFVHEKKCKAQYNNYQTMTSNQNTLNYGQQSEGNTIQYNTNTNTNTNPAVIAPIISTTTTTTTTTTTLPQSHINNVNSTLGSQANKTYIDSVQKMNAHAAAAAAAAATAAVVGTSSLHVHPSPDITDVASAVRNIAIIGQVFYS